MEQVLHCPICNSAEQHLACTAEDFTVSHERFLVQCCSGCGFHFTSPRPGQEQIGAYYLSENYISHAAMAHSFKDRIYHRVRRKAIGNKHALIAKYQPHGNALDMGCGTGDFLAFLKQKGYKVLGVEVSPDAREVARGKGIDVYANLSLLPSSNQFEVITLWHVLEHVADPRTTLRELVERMAEGGLLVVAVPDHESWDCQHYGPLWAAWDVPRHLSHFRRKDIKRIFQETGLELIEVRNMWFDAPYVSMLSEQYRGAGPIASLIKGALIGLWSNAIARCSSRPTSSSLYLAKKPQIADKGQ